MIRMPECTEETCALHEMQTCARKVRNMWRIDHVLAWSPEQLVRDTWRLLEDVEALEECERQ